jgi:hypothetical protein
LACELIVLVLYFAFSLQMYQFPIGDGEQKWMCDILDTLYLENANDKSSPVPCHCNTLHCTPSECRRVWIRWSAPCWCWFDYSTHSCEVLSSSIETNDFPNFPQEVWERVDVCTTHTSVSAALLSAVYWGWWLYIWTSALKWYKIQLFFIILQWFCLIFNLSGTQFDGLYHQKDLSPTYSSLTLNLFLISLIASLSLGMEFFHTAYFSVQC